MKLSPTKSLTTICVATAGLVLGAAGPTASASNAGPDAATTKTEIQASILPAATFAVGSSLSGGPDGKSYGVGLTANDVSNSWTTCKGKCTLDFAFFVFTNRNETAKVQFKVLSPSGKDVYQYTWTSKLVDTNWYSAYAKGNYSSPGTYFAEVYVSGALVGWTPIQFAKA